MHRGAGGERKQLAFFPGGPPRFWDGSEAVVPRRLGRHASSRLCLRPHGIFRDGIKIVVQESRLTKTPDFREKLGRKRARGS